MPDHHTSSAVDRSPAGATGATLPDGTWIVEPRHSRLGFAVKEGWGLRTVRGTFGAFTGGLTVRGDHAQGELTVETASVDTGNARRDRHLRSPAFFDAGRHTRIGFAVTAVTVRDGGVTIEGQLAIGSARVALSVPMDAEHFADGKLRLVGRTAVAREAAGLTWNKLGMIRGDAELHARLTLERAASS